MLRLSKMETIEATRISLPIEMYKVNHDLLPDCILEVFHKTEVFHNARSATDGNLHVPDVRKTAYGLNLLVFHGPRPQNALPH